MLARKKYRNLIWFLLTTILVYAIPLSAQGAGTPAFQSLVISSQLNNSIATLEFSEKVYPGINSREKITKDDLNVILEGGTATLGNYDIEQQPSRTRVSIFLDINGEADGNEILKVSPAGADQIFNNAGMAMDAGAQISANLNETTAPEFAEGYPKIENLTATSADLKIKSNENGTAYYVVAREGMIAPAYTEVRFGYVWHVNGWGPANNNRKGSVNLAAGTEASCPLSGLMEQNNYDLYVILSDQARNFSSVKKVKINRAVSHDATISSIFYTVDNSGNSISGVVYGTSLADFKDNLISASGASFEVYEPDQTTVATDLADGYQVKVTAQDGTTQKIYTIDVTDPPLSNDATLSSLVYTVDNNTKTISGVVYGTSLADFKNNLTPASGASFEVYEPDQTTVASDLADGYQVKVTSQDNTADNTYTVTIPANKSSACDMTSFSFQGLTPAVIGSINGTSINLTIPASADLTALVASFSSSAGSTVKIGENTQTSGVTTNNFTNPLIYSVTAEDGSTKTYTVTATQVNSSAEISEFSLTDPSVQAIISETDILLIVPHGTAPTDLVANFTLSENAIVKIDSTLQTSGTTSNDFSSPVIYTVTAQDGTTKEWTVTVVDELDALKNAVLVGKQLFQLDNTDSFTFENVISAMNTDSKLYFKSSNGKWYDLYQINSLEDLFDASKALGVSNPEVQKWYKAGSEVEYF